MSSRTYRPEGGQTQRPSGSNRSRPGESPTALKREHVAWLSAWLFPVGCRAPACYSMYSAPSPALCTVPLCSAPCPVISVALCASSSLLSSWYHSFVAPSLRPSMPSLSLQNLAFVSSPIFFLGGSSANLVLTHDCTTVTASGKGRHGSRYERTRVRSEART